MVGLMFVLLGVGVVGVNLIDHDDMWGPTFALVLGAGALALIGGVTYLVGIDGGPGFRSRGVRAVGWTLMLLPALLPSTWSIVLIPILLLALPTLFIHREDEMDGLSAR